MNVRARVTVTLEILVADAWDEKVTADQVRKQAIESATGAIRAGMTVNMTLGTDRSAERGWATVVGEPKVEAIIANLTSR